MAHLRQQFKDALSAIEPAEDKVNAPEAHRLVRETLQADETLSEYGVNPVLIGSYKRSVSIRRIKDVDVFVRLPDLPTDVTSADILDRFFKVLHAEFGSDSDGHRRTRRQARSLQVSFPEYDLHVDAVPARQHWDGETWEIPQKDGDNEWVRTNPEKLTSLSSAMNSDHNELYVPTVKLLRQTRRTVLGKRNKPGGFFFEIAAYEAFKSGAVSGTDQAEYYVSALAKVSSLLTYFVKYGLAIPDPTLPGSVINVQATEEEWTKAEARMADAAVTARNALNDKDGGQATLAFRSLLGKDEDGNQILPMPPGYDEDGRRLSGIITPGERIVPAGKRTFG